MKILLNDQWKLQCFDENSINDKKIVEPSLNTEEWMPIKVPGDVHSTLLENGKIEDPFYSTNVEKCRWVEDKVWWYKGICF